MGSCMKPCMRAWIASPFSQVFASAFIASMIGRGVPAGADMPNQISWSKPGSPSSARVGISGAPGLRRLPVSARPRSRPSLRSGSEAPRLSTM